MTFNIGSQTGGVVNNVARDQVIYGGQQGISIGDREAQQAFDQLRAGLTTVQLSRSDAAEADVRVKDVDAEIRSQRPERSVIARALTRLTELLLKTGSLITAGVAVIGPLRTLGSWLGALGEPILRLLPSLT